MNFVSLEIFTSAPFLGRYWPAQCDPRVGDDASISTALGRPPPTALGSCSQKISRGPIELADACARADSEFGRLQAAGWPNFWRKGCGFGPRP